MRWVLVFVIYTVCLLNEVGACVSNLRSAFPAFCLPGCSCFWHLPHTTATNAYYYTHTFHIYRLCQDYEHTPVFFWSVHTEQTDKRQWGEIRWIWFFFCIELELGTLVFKNKICGQKTTATKTPTAAVDCMRSLCWQTSVLSKWMVTKNIFFINGLGLR